MKQHSDYETFNEHHELECDVEKNISTLSQN